MAFLKTLFFESQVYLGVLSFVIFASVLLLRPRIESASFRSRSLPITLLLVVGLFILQATVKTERETLLARLDQFVNAIVEPDVGVLAEVVGKGYNAEDLNHQGFLDSLERWMERYDVYDVRYRKREVTFSGNTMAELELGVMATVQIDKRAGQTHFGTWRIDWRKVADAWYITSIRPIQIDGYEIQQMRPYLR